MTTYSVNEKMFNRAYALKNITVADMRAEISNLGNAIREYNPDFHGDTDLSEKATKSDLLGAYERFNTLYTNLKADAAEKEAEASLEAEKRKVRGTVKKETPAENKKRLKEEAKAAKKAAKESKEKKSTGGVRVGDAKTRLETYSAELKEKETVKNPDKAVLKRIASLKRKIARAEKALA